MSQYPEVDFLYLSEADMVKAGVMDMDACINAMEEVLKCLSVGDFIMGGTNHYSHGSKLFLSTSSPFPNMPLGGGEDRRFMAMPAYIGGPFDKCGVKWYGSNMKNKEKGLPRSILMFILSDKDTGAPLAFMSANLLSAYRTGGVCGVGARHLGPENAHICGIYGPGVMGQTALDAFIAARPTIDTVKIKGRSQRGIDAFVEYVKEKYPSISHIEVVDSAKEMMRDCDMAAFAATTGHDPTTYPYVKTEWVKPGALLVCPGSVNFDDDFLSGGAKLVMDARGLYEAWVEENPYPTYGKVTMVGAKFMDLLHEGKIENEDVCDLGDILLGRAIGRKSECETIVYSVGGMPVEDVAWATVCYKRALEQDIGVRLPVWDRPLMS
ncbi:MAG: tyramine oxidase subunit B [Lachnospiraceae bacterium]|nr:tyramine oxidase subunit B [Lachnospiraceae bacterium]